MQDQTTILRLWKETHERLRVIGRETGMDNKTRAVDAISRGWFMLDDAQRREAIVASTTEIGGGSAGQPQQFRSDTRDRLEAGSRETGMNFVRLVDAMSHGWALLTDEQKREAIRASAPPVEEPETKPRRPRPTVSDPCAEAGPVCGGRKR